MSASANDLDEEDYGSATDRRGTEERRRVMPDERVTSAVKLFQDAWDLLSDLTALKARLPDPNMRPTGPLPADWNEYRSYAVCVDSLRIDLGLALWKVIQGLESRKELQIRDALLPPGAKVRLPGQTWLDWLDDPEPRGGA
jgi:hypothetical protein